MEEKCGNLSSNFFLKFQVKNIKHIAVGSCTFGNQPIQWYHSQANPIWPHGTFRDFFRFLKPPNGSSASMLGKSANMTVNLMWTSQFFKGNPAVGWRRNRTKNILLEIRKYFSEDYFQLSAMIACTVNIFSFFQGKCLVYCQRREYFFINVLLWMTSNIKEN
jgi:hypothetical protein